MLERPGYVGLLQGHVSRQSQGRLLVVEHIPIRSVRGFVVQKDAHVIEIQYRLKLEWKDLKQLPYIPILPQESETLKSAS